MKKFLAVFLAMVLCLSVFSALAEAVNPDDIEDNMTSADGKYEIAFVTDVGDLKDKSFNEGTWNGVKLYAHDNGMSYKYYKPANDSAATDDDRYDAMKAAAEAGAKAIVCAGFMQGTALEKAAKEYPDVKFIFIDGWAMGLDNEVGVVYKEDTRSSWTALRSWASPAAAAAPILPAAVTATASSRARTTRPRSWARMLKSNSAGLTALLSPLPLNCRP